MSIVCKDGTLGGGKTALCGEPLGSQQTLLRGSVWDCYPPPVKPGTPAAPGHPTVPSVLSCGGKAGLS